MFNYSHQVSAIKNAIDMQVTLRDRISIILPQGDSRYSRVKQRLALPVRLSGRGIGD
ncbi:hypothetical protein [Moorena sp. SIO3B2]|uniref:hypothetical protein n=1 Tax=Moorena sp. SIO3B2 TaxID=2607827 RepID=UPI0013CBFC58|nr:hypothetical protein [Moorena sp. SIO3B2]NEP34363.1 hypothetical protein [Moorena sp. SIO3B2]